MEAFRVGRIFSDISSSIIINRAGLYYSMKEKTLLRIALAVGLLGIALLFLLSQRISVDEAMITRLDGMVEEDVVVTGVVVGVDAMDSVTFVMLQKDEMISVTLFGKTPALEVGDLVQVRGTVEEHEGDIAVVGEEIRVV